MGVAMVAISPDTPAELARMKRRRNLGMVLLSDEKLVVADLYNVRHDRALAPVRGPLRALVIPTTVLVDGAGIVRWTDQTSDYRVRSDAARVMDRIAGALGFEEVSR